MTRAGLVSAICSSAPTSASHAGGLGVPMDGT